MNNDHEQCAEDCRECLVDALASVITWAASRLRIIAELADGGADVGDLLRTQADTLRNVLIFEGDPEDEVELPKPSHLKLVE